MALYTFSAVNRAQDEKAGLLVQSLVALTKMAINKYHKTNILTTNYSINEDYDKLNERLKRDILTYCAEKAGLVGYDMTKKEDVFKAFTNPIFEWNYFAIQTEALNSVNADNEVEDVMIAANISTVGIGDSKTFELESKSLYRVQDGAYGNNTTRYQEQFKDTITLTPQPKSCAVDFDVMQLVGLGYDFGKQIAKVAMSFRTKMYVDVVEALFAVANVSTTPFYKSTFAKSTYIELADRVNAANGNVGVTSYGTKQAFGAMSDTVTTGFAVQDELNKTGFIGNLYGVTSVLFDQAVDSNVAAYTFRVPNDRVVLLSSVGDKPVKVVREGNIIVTDDDGRMNALYRRVYKYQDSWKVGLATQAAYGIQEV